MGFLLDVADGRLSSIEDLDVCDDCEPVAAADPGDVGCGLAIASTAVAARWES